MARFNQRAFPKCLTDALRKLYYTSVRSTYMSIDQPDTGDQSRPEPPAPPPSSVGPGKDLALLGKFGEDLQRVLSQLRPDGPELDFALLVDFIDGELDPVTKQQVERNIVTWRMWYDAFWEMVGAQRAGNDCPEVDQAQ